MLDTKDLEAIAQLITPLSERLDRIETDLSVLKGDLSELKEDLSELKEDHEVTRDGVNSLLNWADDVAVVVKVPLKPAN